MDDPEPPALRASDADRERTAEALRDAAGDGRLTVDELDERLHSAYEARTRAELERLLADISRPATRQPARGGYPSAGARAALAGSRPFWAAPTAPAAGGSRPAAP